MRGRNVKEIMYWVDRLTKTAAPSNQEAAKNLNQRIEWCLNQVIEAAEVDLLPEGTPQMAEIASLLFTQASALGETNDLKRVQFITGALWALQWAKTEVKRKKPNHSVIQRRQLNGKLVLQPKLSTRQNLPAENQKKKCEQCG